MPIGHAQVGDVQGVRQAVANVHSNVYDALSQYVANSVRAYRELAQNGGRAPTNPPEVRIYLNRRRSKSNSLESIVISDDATGMTQEEISQMPNRMGRSEHRDTPGSNAYYNLGHLSFMYFAESCLYQTKHYKMELGRHELSSLKLVGDTTEFVYNDHLKDRDTHGTDVTITDIGTNYHRRLTPRLIARDLSSKFRGVIGRGVEIKIIETNGRNTSEPLIVQNKPYTGTEIVSRTYSNIKGLRPVNAVIYYNPSSKSPSQVALLHNGEEYGFLAGSNLDPDNHWDIPGLEGHITFDSGNPRPDKKGFVYPDNKASIFDGRVIKPLGSIVLKETEQLKAKHEAVMHEQTYQKVNDALSHSISDLEILEFPYSRTGGRRRTLKKVGIYMDPQELDEQMKKNDLTITDMDELVGNNEFSFTAYFQHDGGIPIPYGAAEVILELFPNIKTGNHPWYKRNKNNHDKIPPAGVPTPVIEGVEGDNKKVGPISKPSREGSDAQSPTPRLHFWEESLGDITEYGDYNPEMGIVRINMDHPDYDKEVTNGTELQRTLYIARVAALQLVSDQLIEFPARAQMNTMIRLTGDLERRLRGG